MTTPILDFVRAYGQKDCSRFHMPGHKGTPFLGCEPMDITEIEGADVLYAPNGIIAQSEQNATELFGTAHTFYSAEGSSLSIKAMLALVATTQTDGRPPLILAARNAHKAFLYACALLDLHVRWLYPEAPSHLCACPITPQAVETAIRQEAQRPAAVYLTSPDYLGNLADVAGIAAVCRSYQVPLLVDNAHGAYLRFLSPSQHPISLGATLCCDSAHKTLPVLTGGAYLHLSKEAPFCVDHVRSLLALFASTSPSYLILQSLDLCNRYLADGYRDRLSACIGRVKGLKEAMRRQGFAPEETEPLKLTLSPRPFGYTGVALASYLRERKIEVEFADDDCLVLMITPETTERDFARLEDAFSALPRKAALPLSLPDVSIGDDGTPACSIRQALFAKRERIPVSQAEGRICAAPTVSCPPAIPIVVSGERITQSAIARLEHYGISQIDVIPKDRGSSHHQNRNKM